MAIPLGPVKYSPEDDPRRPRPPGLLRRGVRGIGWLLSPLDWFGRREVTRGADDIAAMARALRQQSVDETRLHVEDDGAFDLRATAFSYGVSEAELRLRLERRRRQTARLAWGFWSVAAASFVAWIWTALTIESSASRWLSLIQFLPFVVLFGLLGVREALTNYQVRSFRAARVREWLAAERGFWPR